MDEMISNCKQTLFNPPRLLGIHSITKRLISQQVAAAADPVRVRTEPRRVP